MVSSLVFGSGINASIQKSAAAVPGVEVLDFARQLCPSGACDRELGGVTIRPDGVHYSIEGAAAVSRWVLEQLQRGARLSGEEPR